jgi:hypothetical protein
MKNTYNNIAKSLIDSGIITKKQPKAKYNASTVFICTYLSHELAAHPELRAKVNKVEDFINNTRDVAKKAGYKFVARDFILNALLKEVEAHTKK